MIKKVSRRLIRRMRVGLRRESYNPLLVLFAVVAAILVADWVSDLLIRVLYAR